MVDTLDGTPDGPILMQIEGAPLLPLPAAALRRPVTGGGAATGGGLAVRVTDLGGIRELVRGDEIFTLDYIDGAMPAFSTIPAASVHTTEFFSGGWRRLFADGGEERGVLLDDFPILVMQRVDPSGAPVTHLLAPNVVSPETLRAVGRTLAARVLRRYRRGHGGVGPDLDGERGREGPSGFAVGPTVSAPSIVTEAFRVLDDAPLSDPTEDESAVAPHRAVPSPSASRSTAPPWLLAGIRDGRLSFVTPADAVEIALGYLMSGRWRVAERLMDWLLDPPARANSDSGSTGDRAAGGDRAVDPHGSDAAVIAAAGRLLVATRWAEWTGRAERLRPHRGRITADARVVFAAIGGQGAIGVAGLPAAFPSSAALLADVAGAIEVLGDATWTDELRGLARDAAEGRQAAPSGPPIDRPTRGLRLPVLGASAPSRDDAESPTDPGSRPASASLPPLDAYVTPDHPSVASRRTLHAARIIRSLVEGHLGARPDAAWGRIRLAPDPGVLPVAEIRIGDGRIELSGGVMPDRFTFRIRQVSGRVPMNVVFEPILPVDGIREVRIGGEPAEVEVEAVEIGAVGDGTIDGGPSHHARIRLQFPLDPERSIDVIARGRKFTG